MSSGKGREALSEPRRAKGLWQTPLDLQQLDLMMVLLMVAARGVQKLTEV